ncbi:cerberus-like [Coregonus clupeaformis]|nr:cerberus-like [Coregonus clupeaformis]
MEEMHNGTRNDATYNGHLPLVSQLTAVASIFKQTSLPGQINDSRQKNAKAFWKSFLLRRRSELLSIIPIRHNEINQQMCRALPTSQRVHHDDCETLVLEDNICFGKCSCPERNTNSEDGDHASCVHCSPVKLTKSVQLKCKNNTQVTKVVTVLEDCQCKLKKGLCSHSRQGPSLFDPILI